MIKKQALTAPDWLARGSVYQVNLRTFSKEGTIQSLTKELPFLHSLGFDVIYLCPVFCEDDSMDQMYWSPRQKKYGAGNPKNPYRISDYYCVDSEYGTEQDVKELVDAAHALDMHILFDLVYMHTAPHSRMLETHPEFVQRNENGEICYTPYFFPYLNFDNKGLCEFLWANMVFLIAEWDVDGFRCDVGDAVPLWFWEEGRRRIQTIKSDAVLINEGFRFESMQTAFDSTYGVQWHEDLKKVFCDGESAHILRESWMKTYEEAPEYAQILRDMENHDTVNDWSGRVEKVAGHDGMEQIQVINYLIDGIPMVYCGNELACEAEISFFTNRFYPGNSEPSNREAKMTEAAQRRQQVMKQLNQLKRDSDTLRYGTTMWLETSSTDTVLSFQRVYDGNKILFIGNTRNAACTLETDISAADGKVLLKNGVTEAKEKQIALQPYGYLVIEYKD